MALLGVYDVMGVWESQTQNTCSSIRTAVITMTVDADTLVILESIPVYNDSSVVWNQVAGQAVELYNANTDTAHFTSVSNFSHDSVLVFRVSEIRASEVTVDYMYVTVNRSLIPGRRIQRILDGARLTLGDKSKDRYSDNDLILLLNEAQEDFCKETKILKGLKEVHLKEFEAFADLPSDCWQLTRASYRNTKLPLMTYADVDHIISNQAVFNKLDIKAGWEEAIGIPQALIYDKNNLDKVRVYPIPANIDEEEDFNGFGVVTSIDALVDDGSVSTEYGVVSQVFTAGGILRVYYVRNPEEILETTDELSIPPMFDIALKYYIIAHSFMNDLDSGWQEKGLQQLRFYEREVQRAKKSESVNHTKTGEFATLYRKGV